MKIANLLPKLLICLLALTQISLGEKFSMKGAQSFKINFSSDSSGKIIFPKSKFWLGGNSAKKIKPTAQEFLLDISGQECIVGDKTDSETGFGIDCKAVNGCSLINPDSSSTCRYLSWTGLCTKA